MGLIRKPLRQRPGPGVRARRPPKKSIFLSPRPTGRCISPQKEMIFSKTPPGSPWSIKAWSISTGVPPTFPKAKGLADALRGVARRPELVLLRIMSRVDGVDSVSIKDERRTRH